MNHTTENTNPTLSEVTETRQGTAEQGALKTIHRNYNKLNGYEAMLHIINKYRFVLYPFIVLSILGSAYSFYMDYTKVFPFMPEWLKITKALFFSIMLEIVRDGSIIAIFNGKMKLPSRLLVITIFLGVTFYLFSTHIKTKNIIQASAVEYAIAHQDEAVISKTNPKYGTAIQELKELQEDLKAKKAEITPKLIENTTSIFINKRNDAKEQKAKIEADIKELKSEIKEKRAEINGYKQENIISIEESQELISSVLLTTLILIESLAMLGAVIKFINKDNADKEVAKHSEIIEEYESISEQMRKTNDELGLMLSRDIESAGNQNVAFIHAIAENRKMFQSQMNQIMEMMANQPIYNFNIPNQASVQAQSVSTYQEPKQPTRKIGFMANSKEEMIDALYKGGAVQEGEKLAPKSAVVDVKKRQQNQKLTDFYKELEQLGVIENRGLGRNGGYFAKADYQTALSVVK